MWSRWQMLITHIYAAHYSHVYIITLFRTSSITFLHQLHAPLAPVFLSEFLCLGALARVPSSRETLHQKVSTRLGLLAACLTCMHTINNSPGRPAAFAHTSESTHASRLRAMCALCDAKKPKSKDLARTCCTQLHSMHKRGVCVFELRVTELEIMLAPANAQATPRAS